MEYFWRKLSLIANVLNVSFEEEGVNIDLSIDDVEDGIKNHLFEALKKGYLNVYKH